LRTPGFFGAKAAREEAAESHGLSTAKAAGQLIRDGGRRERTLLGVSGNHKGFEDLAAFGTDHGLFVQRDLAPVVFVLATAIRICSLHKLHRFSIT
jgi:hypothetical protein